MVVNEEVVVVVDVDVDVLVSNASTVVDWIYSTENRDPMSRDSPRTNQQQYNR